MMDNTIILAKTDAKDSYNTGGRFFIEWGIRKVDSEEVDLLISKYGSRELYKFFNPFVSVRRRVDITSGGNIAGDWEILDFADGEVRAARSIGDSEYYTANSLHDLHKEEVILLNKVRELQKELKELEDYSTSHKFSRRSKLQEEYQYKFDRELRKRKLFKKAQNNKCDPVILESIKNPISTEYHNEINRITKRIDAIKIELEEIDY